jgi:rare lipoprotein A
LRPRTISRAAVMAGALSVAAAGPAAAQNDIDVSKKRLHVRAGHRVAVVGAAHPAGAGVAGGADLADGAASPAGLVASLQVHSRDAWRTLDRDRTTASGRYVLRARLHQPMSAAVRVHVPGARRKLGRVNVYRWALASWYGPGLYGNPLGCGGTLSAGQLGVAHRTLPCGSKVTLRHDGRTVRVPVIDRGPYVGGREFDLTEATAQRLGFHGHGAILTTR